jgi:hypothetical protein
MGLFDGYLNPEDFRDSGGLLGRLLSLQQQQGQYQPGAGFDQASSIPETRAPMPLPWPNLADNERTSSVPQPPEQDLHSQYQVRRPYLGDRNAMLATIYPDAGNPLIAQALVNQQKPDNIVVPGSPAQAIKSALTDLYNQTILRAGRDIAGYAADAVNDPAAFSHSIGPSLAALGPIVSELPAIIRGVAATGILRPVVRSTLGDLTASEIQRIQSVVNEAGRPLEVVGSAARGNRTIKSDIDYVVPPSSMRYYDGLQGKLPGVDPKHGIIPGVGNPGMGPAIRFEPK